MLHIILLILKIIGIILLCAVGILLFVTVSVMFVPVRYRIRLSREEGDDKPPVVVYAKITWLLHLVNALVTYPAKSFVRVRILIFTVFRMPKEKKAGKARKSKKPESARQQDEKGTGGTSGEAETDEGADADKIADAQDPAVLEEKETSDSSSVTEDEKKSLFTRIRRMFTRIRQILKKIKGFFENIQYTIRKFCDKIKAASDNIQHYREVLESVPFRQSFELCKEEIGWVLKKLKPDRFEADLIIGMEDPATTGEILAIYGILYPLVGQHVRVVGDFDSGKKHIEGQLYIRGRVRVITLVRTAVRIYFNKDIKRLIKLLKKEAE